MFVRRNGIFGDVEKTGIITGQPEDIAPILRGLYIPKQAVSENLPLVGGDFETMETAVVPCGIGHDEIRRIVDDFRSSEGGIQISVATSS